MSLVILNIIGWAFAFSAFALLLGQRRLIRDYRKIHEQQREKIDELDRIRLAGVKADPDGLKWYRDECTRLTLKCHAICSQIRKMKGRGRVTCQMDPQHHF